MVLLLLLHPSFFGHEVWAASRTFELRRSYGVENVPFPNQPTPITRHHPLRFPIDIYGQDLVLKLANSSVLPSINLVNTELTMYIPRDAYRPRVIDYRQSEAYESRPPRPDQTALLLRVKREAPTLCEVCDFSLPTFEDRERHMAETRHCACPECKGYIPPGCVYEHYTTLHDDIQWNDHYINAGDKDTLLAARPWARERFQNMYPQRDIKEWLGLSDGEARFKSEGEVAEQDTIIREGEDEGGKEA